MPHATGNKIEKEYKFDVPSNGPRNPKVEPLLKLLGVEDKLPESLNFEQLSDFLQKMLPDFQLKKRDWKYFEIPSNKIDTLPFYANGMTLSLRSRPDVPGIPAGFVNWDLTLKVPNRKDRLEYNIELDIRERGKVRVHDEGAQFFIQLNDFMKFPGKWEKEMRHKTGKERQNKNAYRELVTILKPYLPLLPVRCATFEVVSLRRDWPRKVGDRTIHFSIDFVREISAALPLLDGIPDVRHQEDFYECEIDLVFGPKERLREDAEFEALRKRIQKSGYKESRYQSKYRKILG